MCCFKIMWIYCVHKCIDITVVTNFYCQFDNDDLSIQTYDWPISCGLSGLDYIDDFILSNIFIIMNLYELTA